MRARHAAYDDAINAGCSYELPAHPTPPERTCTCYNKTVCQACAAWRRSHPFDLFVADTDEPLPTWGGDLQARITATIAEMDRVRAERESYYRGDPRRSQFTEELRHLQNLLSGMIRAEQRADTRQRAYVARRRNHTPAELWAIEDQLEAELALAIRARDALPEKDRQRIGAQAQVRSLRQRLRNTRAMIAYQPRHQQPQQTAS